MEGHEDFVQASGARLRALAALYYAQVEAGTNRTSPDSELAAARLGSMGVLHVRVGLPVDGLGASAAGARLLA